MVSRIVFYTTALFLMPLYLSIVRHYDEVTIGLLMLPNRCARL